MKQFPQIRADENLGKVRNQSHLSVANQTPNTPNTRDSQALAGRKIEIIDINDVRTGQKVAAELICG